jgi:adenylyl cyclase-associated protein
VSHDQKKLIYSNPAVITWHKAYSSLIEALQKYVKQWHTTGVTWNPKVRYAY